jgi:hypothetical protein
MKTARVIDKDDGAFALEYDNNLGRTNTMSLEALTYENAIREAKSFLGIKADNVDADGTLWNVE